MAIFFNDLDFIHIDYDYIVGKIMANFAGLIFIQLAINWTFISNGVAMLDIAHSMYKILF